MADLIDRPRGELTEIERSRLEEFEFLHGPMSLLNNAKKFNTPVMISCRNNHKLIGKVKEFDRHCNLVLENVREIWDDKVKNNAGKIIKINKKERFISKLFLRGDSVIIVLKIDV
ncbi:unnamed protein product [Candida verbasci]|uniref:Small nuclear ribonucleoprotein Sm D2 n=1 Tax=Candida verbasci TaxID=1227364 RepID=A0A9W4TSY7_9ASCO|nr:unnamed protein product [Candida verbasci]